MSVLEVNVQGPHLVTKALLPALKRSKRKLVANISSTMGSIAMAEQYMFAHTPAYKISKATLNMLNKQYALYLGEEGLTFVVVSPGVSHSVNLFPSSTLTRSVVVANGYGH